MDYQCFVVMNQLRRWIFLSGEICLINQLFCLLFCISHYLMCTEADGAIWKQMVCKINACKNARQYNYGIFPYTSFSRISTLSYWCVIDSLSKVWGNKPSTLRPPNRVPVHWQFTLSFISAVQDFKIGFLLRKYGWIASWCHFIITHVNFLKSHLPSRPKLWKYLKLLTELYVFHQIFCRCYGLYVCLFVRLFCMV